MSPSTLDKLKDAQKLKLDGGSYAFIASRCGVSIPTVVNYFQRGNGKPGPGRCSICGKESKVLHRHHSSYEHLNKVERVCNACHLNIHNQERIKKGFETWSKLVDADVSQGVCRCCWGTGKQLDHEQLGVVVHRIRIDRQESLYDASKRLGISASHLCLLEHGKRRWTKELYLRAIQ